MQPLVFEPEDIGKSKSIFGRTFLIVLTFVGIGVLFVLISWVKTLEEPPLLFPVGTDVTIREGATVSAVSDQFDTLGLVKSGLYFYLVLESDFSTDFIQAGTYRFPKPLTVSELSRAITSGDYASPPVSVTFPEGFKVSDMLEYLPSTYDAVSVDAIRDLEGFLFPDTYFIQSDTTFEELVAIMRENFNEKIKPLESSIQASGLTEKEVVTLASIVEREGNDETSMKMISGILLKRLELGMPLQVDATLDYLLGKSSDELTGEDLELDSPFNTYLYKGLPPAPISNPGITALTAVLEPTESKYLYYLTGTDGEFYYAKTFEEHKQNKARYLR